MLGVVRGEYAKNVHQDRLVIRWNALLIRLLLPKARVKFLTAFTAARLLKHADTHFFPRLPDEVILVVLIRSPMYF